MFHPGGSARSPLHPVINVHPPGPARKGWGHRRHRLSRGSGLPVCPPSQGGGKNPESPPPAAGTCWKTLPGFLLAGWLDQETACTPCRTTTQMMWSSFPHGGHRRDEQARSAVAKPLPGKSTCLTYEKHEFPQHHVQVWLLPS